MDVLKAVLFFASVVSAKYLPTWESLDSRPLPDWYDEAKLGIFIHWGVFSVPSFRSEWFWWDWQGVKTNDTVEFMKKNYKPDFTYGDFAKQFTAEFFEASEWARIFQDSGAKFIVFVSKHHEGYTNWPSKYSFNWNSKAVGPNRDIVGELAEAVKSQDGLRFGLYHSLFEWFHPWYLADKKNNFTTQEFVDGKTLPELYELVNTYKPDVVWSDGDWEASADYWKSKDFLAWLYNDSPVQSSVVTNDRWGQGVMCHHGGFFTCQDRYNPHHLIKHKWENAMTIDRQSWGFRRRANVADILSIEELLEELITTISCNGNVLLNVGPTHDGMIGVIYQERLHQLGSWLKVNGEGVYSSRPWTYQNDTVTPGVWYTSKSKSQPPAVYAFLLQWPEKGMLYLNSPFPTEKTEVTLLGYSGPSFKWTSQPTQQGIHITFPALNVKQMPCKWAWVLKMTNIKN
ncbi:alpha-L-fucosidase [Aplysia californica]|uniref:alpha-L-fucosidase n=1 Tax=Aplysia californica TaxID=6500 RepID=A0ABM0JND4_APLCA|nr:alpha-L-fucosidase [Aplysia californica]